MGLFWLSYWILIPGGVASAQEFGWQNLSNISRPSFSVDHQHMTEPGGEAPISIEEQRLSLNIPLFDGSSDDWSLGLKLQRAKLGQKVSFSQMNRELPDEFGGFEIGPSWVKSLPDGDKWGATLGVGYAGTQVLSGDASTIISTTGFWEKKKTEAESWIFFLNYSNNRTTFNNIPLPGFAYLMKTASATLFLGLPFTSVIWRVQPYGVILLASPFVISTEGNWLFFSPMQFFSGLSWSPRAYEDLVPGSDNRLIIDKKEFTAGLRLVMGPKGSISAGYVYGFDRRLMWGESVSDSSAEAIALQDSAGFAVRARMTF